MTATLPRDQVYLGNPLLKKANTQMEFTEEQIIEFVKCKEDPVYFAKKFLRYSDVYYFPQILLNKKDRLGNISMT